jgi:hypothetical protein
MADARLMKKRDADYSEKEARTTGQIERAPQAPKGQAEGEEGSMKRA